MRYLQMMKNKSNKELLAQAVAIAQKIVNGDIGPNEGCTKIGEINSVLNWPDELTALGALAHEQYDHENIGITAEDCISEIINECKKLIKNQQITSR